MIAPWIRRIAGPSSAAPILHPPDNLPNPLQPLGPPPRPPKHLPGGHRAARLHKAAPPVAVRIVSACSNPERNSDLALLSKHSSEKAAWAAFTKPTTANWTASSHLKSCNRNWPMIL